MPTLLQEIQVQELSLLHQELQRLPIGQQLRPEVLHLHITGAHLLHITEVHHLVITEHLLLEQHLHRDRHRHNAQHLAIALLPEEVAWVAEAAEASAVAPEVEAEEEGGDNIPLFFYPFFSILR
jgi:hypothetical protein